jgi:hypothetical protein
MNTKILFPRHGRLKELILPIHLRPQDSFMHIKKYSRSQ